MNIETNEMESVASFQRFEDLIAWQKARVLARDVYAITRREPFARDFGLSGQIQRAAVSVMSNIAEGYERDNPNELYRFLGIAKGSCGEVRSQLYLAKDIAYVTQEEFDVLRNQAEELARIIAGLMRSVSRNRQ